MIVASERVAGLVYLAMSPCVDAVTPKTFFEFQQHSIRITRHWKIACHAFLFCA
jgi:hypothetical protein